MESVSIQEDENVSNMSLESQSEQQDKQELSGSSDRPEWLPEKFQSPAEMAKAYGALESKLGSDSSEETEDIGETPEQNEAISSARDEFDENGELSDSAYDALSKSGITREMVDLYIQGAQAEAGNEEVALKGLVGGDENYQRMAEWAQNTLSEEEQSEFDEVVTTGSSSAAKFAIQGLYSRFSNESGGFAPLLGGSTSNSPSSETFRSTAQVREAMSDPRYSSDPAYRNLVADRLRHSNIM